MARGYPDFEGGKAGTYSIDEWAASEGYDQNLYTTANNIAINGNTNLTYLVPAGRTLYIVSISIFAFGFNDADKDNNQMCSVRLLKTLPLPQELLAGIGGNGGAGIVFRKPVRFTTGQTLTLYGDNRANHAQTIGINALGYEVVV